MSSNKILFGIDDTGSPQEGQTYWMIPADILDAFDDDDRAAFDAIAGLFRGTGEYADFFFIPRESSLSTLDEEIQAMITSGDVWYKYILSDLEPGGF